MAGLGYLFFIGVAGFFEDRDADEQDGLHKIAQPEINKGQPAVINEDIAPEEDDLLKDMDLSDLDDLNLDDFD
nr:hypothetical protein [Desulfobacter latus]